MSCDPALPLLEPLELPWELLALPLVLLPWLALLDPLEGLLGCWRGALDECCGTLEGCCGTLEGCCGALEGFGTGFAASVAGCWLPGLLGLFGLLAKANVVATPPSGIDPAANGCTGTFRCAWNAVPAPRPKPATAVELSQALPGAQVNLVSTSARVVRMPALAASTERE